MRTAYLLQVLKDTGRRISLCHAGIIAGFILLGQSVSVLAQDSPITDVPEPGYLSVVAGGSENVGGSPAISYIFEFAPRSMDLDSKERVYFENRGVIRRIDLDGTISSSFKVDLNSSEVDPETSAGDLDSRRHDFVILGNYLYFLEEPDYRIYRVNIETGLKQTYRTVDRNVVSDCCSTSWPIAIDSSGNIYLSSESQIWRIDAVTGDTSHFAGNGGSEETGAGIPATEASISVEAMVVDLNDDSLLLIDGIHHRVSRIEGDTNIIEFASEEIYGGFFGRLGMSIDVQPSGDILFRGSQHIMKVTPASGQITVIGGSGFYGSSGDGGSPLSADMQPTKIAVGSNGDYYFTNESYIGNTARIRYVEAERNIVSTIAGIPGFLACSSPPDNVLKLALGIEFDLNGLIYIQSNFSILTIDPELDTMFTSVGIYGVPGWSNDGVPAFGNPIFPEPRGLDPYKENFAVAPNGNIYVAERGKLRVIDRHTDVIDTLVNGQFYRLHHDGGNHLYAIREQGDRAFMVRISDSTGQVTTIFEFGSGEYAVVGQSVEGKRFGSDYIWDGILNLAVDSGEDIYIAFHGPDTGLRDGIYKIDGQTKILTLLTSGDVIEVGRALALDEHHAFLYFGPAKYIQGANELTASIIRVDLLTGGLERVAGTALGLSYYPIDPHDSDFYPEDMVVAANGDLYIVDVANNEESQVILKISSEFSSDVGLIPDDIDADSRAAQSLAYSDNWLAVGVPNGHNGAGEVLVYQDNDCRPILQNRLQAPDGTSASQFGSQLAFVDGSLVIGASGDSSQSSRIQSSTEADSLFRLGVFGVKDRLWHIDKDLSAFLPPVIPNSDSSLVSDEGMFAVGSPGANNGEGEVTVFDNKNIENPIEVSAPAGGMSGFGKSLALAGGNLAVGADSASGGSAEVFRKSGSSYQHQGNVVSSNGSNDFAVDLAMDDETLYVGAPHSSGGRVYDYNLDGLELSDTLVDPGGSENPSFGKALAIEDDVLVVGAPDTPVAAAQNNDSAVDARGDSNIESNHASGAVHVFGIKDRFGRKTPGRALFSLLARIAEAFGDAIDITNGRIVVGAPETNDGKGTFDPVDEIINASDLSGLWYDPSLDGEGFNLLVADAGLVVFFYGYDSNGERLWLVSETFSGEFGFGEEIRLSVYKAVAGEFDSPVSSSQALVKYGLLSMSFGSLRSGTFTINGFDGNKISRSAFLADTGANAAAYSGLWYDAGKDGEGYNVISGAFGSVFYYYGSSQSGERLWLVSDLLTNNISDGTTVSGKMYEARGGDFYHPEPSATALRDWGTIEARFDNCHDGRFILNGSDGNKTSNVIKLAGVEGAECQ